MVLKHLCDAILHACVCISKTPMFTFIPRMSDDFAVFSSDPCTGRHPSGPRVCPLHRLGGRRRFRCEVFPQVQKGKW